MIICEMFSRNQNKLECRHYSFFWSKYMLEEGLFMKKGPKTGNSLLYVAVKGLTGKANIEFT